MEHLDKLKDNICRELEKMSRIEPLNSSALDAIDKLTHSLKSIETIKAMEESKNSYDYSMDGYSNRRGYSRLENKVRGDRIGGSGYSNYGYSRNNGYSGKSDMLNLKSKLENMLQNAKNEEEREVIEEWLMQI